MSVGDEFVTITASNGLGVVFPLGEGSARVTGGYGGWEAVDRPRRRGFTRFKGSDPRRMDIPFRFDGWSDDESQETSIAILEQMASQTTALQQPPTVQVDGAVPRTDLTWVIDTIDWSDSDVIWDVQGDDKIRLRQGGTLHLLEFIDANVLVTSPVLSIVDADPGKSVDAKGRNAKKIAQDEYGMPAFWTAILGSNPLLPRDPRLPIPAGTTVYVPPKKVASGS